MSLWYARPSKNVAALVTPTLNTGTINALYPITRLIDNDPATATKTTSTGDSRWLWSFAGAQRIDGFWLPMYKAAAGTVIRFEGHTSDLWTAPDISRSLTVPAFRGSGSRALPRGLFIDVRTDPNYTTVGKQYWSLFVPNAGIITALGEAFLASEIETVRHFQYGLNRPRSRNLAQHARADGGWFTYSRGTDAFRWSGSVLAGSTEYDAYLELHEDCDGGRLPFAVVFDSHLANPEGFLMQWASGFGARADFFAHDLVQMEWQMVPRGRAL